MQQQANPFPIEEVKLVDSPKLAVVSTSDWSTIMAGAMDHEPTRVQRAGAVAYYMAASVLTQSATKAVMTTFGFNFPITLCLAQMAFTAPVCAFLGGRHIASAQILALVPLGLVNCVNIVSGLSGTGGLSIPMFIVIRRFTMLFTLVLEYCLYSKQHAWQVIASVSVMIMGAIVAAATDLSFNAWGYFAVLMNDLFTALYLVMIKYLKAGKGLDTLQLLYCNSLVSVLPLLIASFAIGEVAQIAQFQHVYSGMFIVMLVFAVCLGLTISHSTYVCTRVNEPLTTSVAGSFKNILMTVIGVFAFGDFHASLWNTIGIVISMMGAVWYAHYTATQKSKS